MVLLCNHRFIEVVTVMSKEKDLCYCKELTLLRYLLSLKLISDEEYKKILAIIKRKYNVI